MKIDILAFGAHPDDVELAASGTLIKAARGGSMTGLITLSRGEMGTRGTVEMRADEFEKSSRIMGLSVHEMLSLPDGRLASDQISREAVVRKIREYRPAIILLPYWEDRHPDHCAASRIVQESAFLSGLRKLDTGQEPHRPAELIYYMASWEFEPSFIVDISDFLKDKERAIRAYGSQVYDSENPRGGEQTFISSEHFWELLLARMAHYGRLIGKNYGEPFKIRGLIEIRDLVDSFGERIF
jgi:bacillithiol biosynthesis deacetylase BshB1